MKKIIFIPILILWFMASCSNSYSDIWTDYADWRKANDEWIAGQELKTNPNGTAYYKKIIPGWNPNAYVLIHYFNDQSETAGNLVPLYTSTVSVKYIGRLYDDTPFDSSYNSTDSLFTTNLASVISGWQIALQEMHVGDSCEVLIPYQQAYFSSSAGVVLPYSCLKFNMKLVDIPYYEVKP